MLVSILDLENVIREFNLSIRYIPLKCKNRYSGIHYKEGVNELVKVEITETVFNRNKKCLNEEAFNKTFVQEDSKFYRLFVDVYYVPSNAGKFLVLSFDNAMSTTEWSKAFIGDTLLAAVEKFLVAQLSLEFAKIKSNNQ
jgi:hypothetical protein